MPEGPSIVIVKQNIKQFVAQEVLEVSGNTKIDLNRMVHQKINWIKTWGKHLLIGFDGFTIRIHFLMFGTYLINDSKTTPLRLGLVFSDGGLNFYTCAVKVLEGDINSHYDWSADVMNDDWNPKKARAKLKEIPNAMICDALLEQDIFSGVGNIIKNEVLYRVRIHPESLTGKIPARKITEIINESRTYSFEFLDWKQKDELKKHWLAYTKKKCLRCDLPMVKKYTGTQKRRSFFCTNCQKLHR